MTRIVLAYSGGLDTSIAIPWLAETYGAEIIAVTVDLGQGRDLEEIRDRALATGALRAHVLDVREEFARDYVVRALKAGVLCHNGSSMAAALGRPLIAQTVVTIARIEQATTVAHGDRDSRVMPLDVAILSLDPSLTVVSPAREWGMTRAQQFDYARERSLTLPAAIAGDGVQAAPRPAAASPDEPAFVDIAIERGVPMAINGVVMPPLDLIGTLDIIAGAHGAGRVERVELSTMIALHEAHQQLQQAAIAGDAARFSTRVAEEYLRLVRNGSWFAPLRAALDAFVDKIQERVSGVVRLKLFKGECAIVDCQLSAGGAGAPAARGSVRHRVKLTTGSDTSTTSRLTTDD
jgi:argininosuccinate synthase